MDMGLGKARQSYHPLARTGAINQGILIFLQHCFTFTDGFNPLSTYHDRGIGNDLPIIVHGNRVKTGQYKFFHFSSMDNKLSAFGANVEK
jgi:hypothetical protein